ncbi:hypothetical protein [Streptomyces sp. NPDC007369]|uniref:hypothetical protein n=1 Tax=Streptomyces sp. NPDC007369 TaxID=3154589 RepID=UPI0033D20956
MDRPAVPAMADRMAAPQTAVGPRATGACGPTEPSGLQARALLQQHGRGGVLYEDGVFTVLPARRPGTAR